MSSTTQPQERPILFSAPMVRAILDGTKTQTRRLIKDPRARDVDGWAHDHSSGLWRMGVCGDYGRWAEMGGIVCPYGAPGDRLWVRETWGLCRFGDATDWYRGKVGPTREGDPLRQANGVEYRADWGPQQEHCFWRPSIHMPRWASRLTLEVTNVRVQRLRDLSDDDIRAEGVTGDAVAALRGVGESGADLEVDYGPIDLWCLGWAAINGAESWAANPWVWAISFRRINA